MSVRLLCLIMLMLAPAFAAPKEPAAAELTSEQSEGRALFNESCVFCHGERGHATTLLSKRLGADNSLLEKRTNLTPELIRHVVRHGINSMPWYPRAELSDRDLQLITAYLLRANAAK
jgi:mono/diheme cytochrome c family protein